MDNFKLSNVIFGLREIIGEFKIYVLIVGCIWHGLRMKKIHKIPQSNKVRQVDLLIIF